MPQKPEGGREREEEKRGDGFSIKFQRGGGRRGSPKPPTIGGKRIDLLRLWKPWDWTGQIFFRPVGTSYSR